MCFFVMNFVKMIVMVVLFHLTMLEFRVVSMSVVAVHDMRRYIAVNDTGEQIDNDDTGQEQADQCISCGNIRQAGMSQILLGRGKHAIE
jgi:hypothetical protein